MSFAGSFQAIAAWYGQTVTPVAGGEIVGTGRAVLRPSAGGEGSLCPRILACAGRKWCCAW